jgi:hypothetical protein
MVGKWDSEANAVSGGAERNSALKRLRNERAVLQENHPNKS